MNTPSLQIGMDDFRMLRKSGPYFVDKSLFISKILRGKQTTLLPRPRRFGKTTNMSMLAAYLDCQQQDQDTLFAGLNVLAEGPDVLAHKAAAALKADFAQIETRNYAAKLRHLACPGITQIALVQQGKKLFIEMKDENA